MLIIELVIIKIRNSLEIGQIHVACLVSGQQSFKFALWGVFN